MEAARRVRLSRVVEKIEKDKNFAEKIGTVNKSKFETKNGGKYKC